MWPVRPNVSNSTNPSSYNLYWDSSSGGGFAKLLGSVDNVSQQDPFGNRSYKKKVVFNIALSQVPSWNNDITNYIKMKAVVGGVEQGFEAIVTIPPYTTNGMFRLVTPEVEKSAIVGWNDAEKRYIPVSVDTSGKLTVV